MVSSKEPQCHRMTATKSFKVASKASNAGELPDTEQLCRLRGRPDWLDGWMLLDESALRLSRVGIRQAIRQLYCLAVCRL